jgi:hypothetical protein
VIRLGIGSATRKLLKRHRPDDSAERAPFAIAANRALAPVLQADRRPPGQRRRPDHRTARDQRRHVLSGDDWLLETEDQLE